jgi:hypothetical protein
LLFDLERTVTTDALKVEQQEQVDHCHPERQVGIGLQRSAVTSLIGGNDRLLIGRALVAGLLGSFELVTRDGGSRREKEELRFRGGLR